MASIDIFTAWTQLPEAEQLHQWRAFLAALDAGDAGYHRYYLVLMPLWDRGDVPAAIEAEAMDAYAAEMRADAAWAAENPDPTGAWFDRCIAEADPCDLDFWSRFDAAEADRILGCPPFWGELRLPLFAQHDRRSRSLQTPLYRIRDSAAYRAQPRHGSASMQHQTFGRTNVEGFVVSRAG